MDPPRWAVQKALLAMAQPMVHKTAHKMAHETVHKMACEMVHETAHEMVHKMAHKTALPTRLGMVLPSAHKRVLLTRPLTTLGISQSPMTLMLSAMWTGCGGPL